MVPREDNTKLLWGVWEWYEVDNKVCVLRVFASMSVRERSDRRGKGGGYWGLVQQEGPWHETKQDVRNMAQGGPVVGGGLGAGGNAHAGNGGFEKLINPYQQNGRRAAPYPSKYVQRKVVSKKPIGIKANKGVVGAKGNRDFQREVWTTSVRGGIANEVSYMPTWLSEEEREYF